MSIIAIVMDMSEPRRKVSWEDAKPIAGMLALSAFFIARGFILRWNSTRRPKQR